MDITVCIVDDNRDIRSALEQIIIMSDGYKLLAGFETAEEAIQKNSNAKAKHRFDGHQSWRRGQRN